MTFNLLSQNSYKVIIKSKRKMIEYQINSVQLLEENKIARIDSHPQQKSAYVEVHSKKFECNEHNELTPRLIQYSKYYTPHVGRYLKRRKFLFSKFDQGIKFDEQSLYSIIPEKVSNYLGDRFKKNGIKKICEPFCGVGGIAVHLCDQFDQYVVNDIDKNKINKLKHNIKVYGKLQHFIKQYSSDFLLMEPFQTDVMIVCPPWGGINVTEYSKKDLDEIMRPTLSEILLHSAKFSKNMLLQMPKNTSIENFAHVLLRTSAFPPLFTIEKIYRNNNVEQLFIYLGEPKFTQINSHVHEVIYRDLGQDIHKKIKKKVKEEVRNNLMIFVNRIYTRYHPPNKVDKQQNMA